MIRVSVDRGKLVGVFERCLSKLNQMKTMQIVTGVVKGKLLCNTNTIWFSLSVKGSQIK